MGWSTKSIGDENMLKVKRILIATGMNEMQAEKVAKLVQDTITINVYTPIDRVYSTRFDCMLSWGAHTLSRLLTKTNQARTT